MKKSLLTKIKPIIKFVLYLPHMPGDFLYCSFHGLKWHMDWRLRGWPLIKKNREAKIEIGKHLLAVSKSYYNSWGVFQPVIIMARRPGCIIKIGDNVGLSGCTITAIKQVVIGNDVLVGSGVVITDNDAHPIDYESRHDGEISADPVVIHDNVFIGARALILKGVTIGKGAVIGAGSVVVKSVPDFAIAAGNPAKVIGDCREK
jgi:acetyltransferase-like isoleucine patch superfamily enzyme